MRTETERVQLTVSCHDADDIPKVAEAGSIVATRLVGGKLGSNLFTRSGMLPGAVDEVDRAEAWARCGEQQNDRRRDVSDVHGSSGGIFRRPRGRLTLRLKA